MSIEEKPEPFEPYYYLWHLVAMGVIKQSGPEAKISDTLWDQLRNGGAIEPSKVVLIDVGCAFAHPNLKGRVDANQSIDFSVSPYGAKYRSDAPNGEAYKAPHFEGLDVSKLSLEQLTDGDKALFAEVTEHLASSKGDVRAKGDVEALFSSHGTAASGLIVGGPEVLNEKDAKPSKGVIPYFGVDPFSEMISVRTGFDNDPLQFLAAFLYAWAQDPDVIVLPRGLPDPDRSAIHPKDDFKAETESWESRDAADLLSRIADLCETATDLDTAAPHVSATGKRLWTIVQSLVVAISKEVPIVCASGNDGESQLNYPANLARPENGILAVGAVSGEGYRSGYSNYGDGLTLVAPSDDMEVFNLHQLRDTKKRQKDVGYLSPEGAKLVDYSRQSLLTTDIPGTFGYDTGGTKGGGEDPMPDRGFYTNFGGTSGATALVGGVIALIRRAARNRKDETGFRDGCDIKALLVRTARRDMPASGEPKKLCTDSMNADDENVDAFAEFFGGGLIDAEAAVKEAMA